MVITMLLLPALVFKVSGTLDENELKSFYRFIENQQVKIVKSEGKGLGVILMKNITAGTPVFCITPNLSIVSSDTIPITEYIKDLSAKEKLKANLLYYKFIDSKQSFYSLYTNSLPNDFSSSTH